MALVPPSPEQVGSLMNTLALAGAWGIYIIYKEIYSKNKDKRERGTEKKHFENLLTQERAHFETKLFAERKLHEEELESLEKNMLYRNDLVNIEQVVCTESKADARRESDNEQLAAIRGKFNIMVFDIKSMFHPLIEHAEDVYSCPMRVELENGFAPVECAMITSVKEAKIYGIDGTIKDSVGIGRQLAEVFVMLNGFHTLRGKPLDDYLDDKSGEIQAAIVGALHVQAGKFITEKTIDELVSIEFVRGYFKDVIASVRRIKGQEYEKVNTANEKFKLGVRKIYGDKRVIQ